MHKKKNNPQWTYRECSLDVALLDKDQTQIEKPKKWACWASLPPVFGYSQYSRNFQEARKDNPIHYLRYYFKQYIADIVALRFLTTIKKWWFIGEVLTLETPKEAIKLGYITIDLEKHTHFRVFTTLSLVRYLEEWPFVVQEVFKTRCPKEFHGLKEFISAHRIAYAVQKIPDELDPRNLMVDDGHGLFNNYLLSKRDKDFKISLEEDTPNSIEEPKTSIPLLVGWDGKPWRLSSFLMKYPKPLESNP